MLNVVLIIRILLGEGDRPVDKKCIVIFLTQDTAQTYNGKPLMLQEALFCPVLNWCMRAWTKKGITRWKASCSPPAS